MKRIGVTLVLFLGCASLLFSQKTVDDKTGDAPDQALQASVAMSNAEYRVTAGDVYMLAYAAGTMPVTYQLIVDSSYKIRVSNLAVIDVEGKTFLEVKAQVEQIVSRNYPMSGVQFVLTSPAVFSVAVTGEVKQTAEPEVWALSRLSSVLQPLLTQYSSTRDVTIVSRSGKSRTYDLFKAQRFGDLSQDPYLRPGDTVRVGRLLRSVKIEGAVERPGTYQLLPGENLKDLVEIYGSGLTPLADPSRIEVIRHIGSGKVAGQKLFFDQTDIDAGRELQHYDAITIHQISDLIPVMFMEGAVGVAEENEILPTPETSNRLTIRFNEGENYANLVRSYRTAFTPVSDTANAYIIRAGERIPLNLNPMLYDAAYHSEYKVEKDDVLIIPFRQYFVTVSGAVKTPGRYPYIPDRDWSYYISLAGGFNTLQNSLELVSITDVQGKKHTKKDPITPETVIEAKTNSFLFYFNQYAPVVTTALSIVSTFLTVIAVTQ